MPLPILAAGTGAAIGGIASGLLGAAGSFFSGKQSADFAERSYKHRYQWQVKDLRKAGLNPMLAVSQGPGNVPQPNFPDIGEGAGRAASALASIRLLKEQANVARATEQETMQKARGHKLANDIVESSPEYNDALQTQLAGGGVGATAAKRVALEFSGKQAIIDNATADLKSKDFQQRLMANELDFKRDIQPLLIQEQRFINRAREAGLPELEAAADFWSSIGATGKALEMILDMVPGGEAISRMLMKRKTLVGKEVTTTSAKGGTTFRQETYDHR